MMLKLLVKHLLENSENSKWSIQGLGMLRLYLSPEFRLHIWSSDDSSPDATQIHDHPWAFRSCIVAGRIHQIRYEEYDCEIDDSRKFTKKLLKCGPGMLLKDEEQEVYLIAKEVESYWAGQSYSQSSHEIHRSFPDDGTVTIVERFFNKDVDHAHVFIPEGESFGSAEPRPATKEEVKRITQKALELF